GIAEAAWSTRHFTFWEIPDPSTFSDTPGVAVEAGYGSLRVLIGEEVSIRPGESVLLKYHWDRGMSVTPPSRIFPQKVLDDPVPFVGLEPNGASSIQITVR
ncbi:MAG: hypothetical protein PHQ19_09555, partial [Candidatus Krumholzibacteria bacterium]|nr:hypothetical protein [Candidatus Krumholzibacteria bacterium]